MSHALVQAMLSAANELHNEWRAAYRANNGDKPRWKPLNDSSLEWLATQSNLPESAIRTNPETQKVEIDIAALTNSQLPRQYSGENTAAAEGAVRALRLNQDFETASAMVHDQWVERNKGWAPDNLKVPYAELPEEEREKDRVIVRVAQNALRTFGL